MKSHNRFIKLISSILVISIFTGFLPWRELRADANTHGEYTSSPFSITYEQDSSWDNSTQGQFTVTNTSEYDVTSWSLQIEYAEDVELTNVWNVTGSSSDSYVLISSDHTIEAGYTYSFGVIVEGQEAAPTAPLNLTTLSYVSDEPEVTPTPEPTPEITDEPTNTPSVTEEPTAAPSSTQEPTVSPSVTEEPTVTPSVTEEPSETPTPTEEPTQTPTPTATETPTSTPTAIPEEEEQNIFPYAIFSGSTTNDFTFQGWRSNITGDVYSGRDFLYQGSELYMEGYARTVGVVNPSGWITSMTGAYEGVDPIEMPDWSESILCKEDYMPSIDMAIIASRHSIYANGYLYVDGDITIDSAYFSGTGDIVIVANGNITYNVDTINSNNEEDELPGRILLYSEEGDITINGNEIEVNGILYAPNGRVSINAYNTTINGRIVADRFSYSGSILNVTADPSDLELVQDLPDVTVTALQTEVEVGQIASYRIDIPEDNVYEIHYRLNGEEVEVTIPDNEEDPVIFSFVPEEPGEYTFEAYVDLPYGEFVLDSDTITVTVVPTPTETPTPEPTATSTPTPTEEPTATPTEEPTITDTPTPTEGPTPTATETPTPTAEPTVDPEDERYYTFSEGDMSVCGYRNPFDEDNWNLSGSVWMNESRISLLNMESWVNGEAVYGGSRAFSPDYSFSGRFTLSLDDHDGGGGRFSISIAPNTSSINTNSIGIFVAGTSNQISILENNDRFNPVASATGRNFTDLGRNNEIWFDYDGQTHIFSVYVAPYTPTGRPEKPASPVVTYEIDLSEKFEGYDEFTWAATASNGIWYATTQVLHGFEIDPYPELHQFDVTPTPTPTPTPESNGFIEFSQGDTEYGYQIPFDEDSWDFEEESRYIDEDTIELLNIDENTHYGSAFLGFSEDVGETYEFYTRFTFSNESEDLSNGLAFVVTPDNDNAGFYGSIGYNMYTPSVIVEFDLDPHQDYYSLDEYGEFREYDESNAHVGILINGNEELHYDVEDYRYMRATDKITDAWVDYDGQTLSVYVCTMNRYGHIYKYEEPIVSIDIDLDELFGGNTILNFGFTAGDFNKNTDVVLHGFEIAQTPFTTLLPNELPEAEQDRYQILSMGDGNYEYEIPFDPEDWNGDRGRITSTQILVASDMYDSQSFYCTESRDISEDYSFSGRFTASISGSDPCHHMNFVLSTSPLSREHSISFHLDTWQSSGAHWRNEFGDYIEGQPDGWYEGEEPFEAMISVCLDGDYMYDYAIAEYMPLRDSGAVHEIWYNYDGTTQMLYVYIATYDENGNVVRPDTPILVCPIDMEEVLDGSHTVYPAYYGKTGFWDYGDYYTYGFEFDPRPDIHNDFDGVLQVLAPLDNREYTVGDTIDISGRIGSSADPDTGITVTVKDSDGNTVYENTNGQITENFGYIDRIDTENMDPGAYTLELTVTDENGDDYVREIPFTLVQEILLSANISGIEQTEDGIIVLGDVSCNEDSSYILQIRGEDSLEWTTVASGNGNKTNESLGLIPSENICEGTNYIRLEVTSVSGEQEEATYGFDLEITDPIEFTDEELFVDIFDDQDGQDIGFITDILGTVSGTELNYYTFEMYPVDSEEAVYTYTSSSQVEDGTLGTIDPTLLMNGFYEVRVTAYADEGSLEDEIIVLVTGQAKVGNFTPSFLDMSLPVAGLPVEIYRTYDSRNRAITENFGYGWDLSIGGPSVSISTELGEDWESERRTTLGIPMYYWTHQHPHEVYIDWGNGHSETFELVLSPDRTVSSNNWSDLTASFTNTSGTSDTLVILDDCSGLTYADNALYTSDLQRFEPQNFLLTRYDGIKFYFNADTGLYKIEDTYGRTIEITEDGILYSDGSSIDFVRNADGQITSIEDGLGNEVIYTYNENDDLISVVDTAGYTTTFTYDDSHYITDITADNGVRIARNEYDEDGRLVATIDADGRRLEFDHDLNDRTEVTTDRLGYNTIYVYDEFGNVLSVTDALGHTTTYTYDDRGNKTSETRPDGTTFTYSYDRDGNLLTANDGNGRNIVSSYGSNGELLTMSAMGVTELTMAYDEHGNLLSATDSSGNTQNYGYDNTGNLTSVTDSLGSLMNMTYDANGNVTSITNAEGSLTNFSYDNEGRLVSRTITYQGQTLTDTYSYDEANRVTGITYANGNTVSYTYNQAGDVTSSTDSQGRTVDYIYDVYGNLTRIDYPDGTHESFTYDAEGRNLTATDRMGRTATFTYDAVGNCTSKTYANGAEESYLYDSCDRIISSTNVYGGVTTYGYDYLGRNTSVQDPQGNTTTYTYNDRGNVASVTDALNNTYSFTYDNNGNQTSVTYPNGSTFSNTYDARGRMTSQSDAYGNTTTYSYDDMDRLVSVTDALNGTWSYAYDSMGNIISVTDANGNTTTYTYDLNGQVTSVTNAAGNTSTTTYDQYGRVVSSSDFGGIFTEYTYDSMDRVATATTAGETTSYTYDAVGNLVSVEDPTGTITYTYNADGFLSSVTNARGESISYSYNEGGQIESISIDGQTISYGYDNMGRLISVTDSEGTTSYTYDAVGNRTSTTYPNGVVTTYGYNSINALVSEVTTDSDDNVIASYTYTIGSNGERLSCTELGRTVEYSYDELERLTSETVTVGSEVSVTTYTYDSNSNRLSMNRDGEVTNYTYNSLNQITQAGDVSYTWDNAGNLVSQSRNGVIAATYTYDCHNRMISADINNISGNIVESYTYDYLGNRTSKTTNGETTYFTTDLSTGYSQVLKAESSSETIYYTRGFELISRRAGQYAHYYLFDGGMSVRGLTDESGVLTDTFVFDAFGNEVARTGTTDNSYGFQGEEKDATGLYYLRARYMDPSTGTFTSMDTYAGSLSDPMSLHKYLFANSNPVKYCDPSGHFSLAEMSLSMALDTILESALFSGFYYCIEANATDPEHNHHDILGYFRSIMIGLVVGVVIVALASTVIGLVILSVIGLICAVGGVIKGIIDIFVNKHVGFGLFEIVSSIITFVVSWRNLNNMWDAANDAFAGDPDYNFDDINGDIDEWFGENSGPVEFTAPEWATPEEIIQMQDYVNGCNEAMMNGELSSTGRVSTQGALRSQASAAAQAERARAATAGSPYVGVVGHVPDTTWTGNPIPSRWADQTGSVNSSLGGQARRYPIGYRPTVFYLVGG